MKTQETASDPAAAGTGRRVRRLPFLLAGMLGAVCLTNRWPGPEDGLGALGKTDVLGYRAIAGAAPGIPGGPVEYHHAQRFWLHWLIGTTARAAGRPTDLLYRLTALALSAAIAWSLALNLRAAGAPSRWQAVLAAVWIFDPYCLRFYLAAPWMAADLLFVLGLSTMALGLLRGGLGLAALGLAVAAFGRQTALVCMPALWLALGRRLLRKEASAGDAGWVAAASALAAGAYLAGGWYAAATGAVSSNAKHLTGLAAWLVSDEPGKAGTLWAFLLRGLAGQALTLALAPALLAGRRKALPGEFWLLAFLVVPVLLQPALGGPVVTGGNISRLWAMAQTGLLAMGALLAASRGSDLKPWAAAAIALAAAAGSLHHRWSLPGAALLGAPAPYAVLLAAVFLFAALACLFGLAPAARMIQCRDRPEGA